MHRITVPHVCLKILPLLSALAWAEQSNPYESDFAIWGKNGEGRILSRPVVAVGVGTNRSIALQDDGVAVAWGSWNTVPDLGKPIKRVYSKETLFGAVFQDGSAAVWGDTIQATKVPTTLANVVSLSLGVEHALAIKSDSTVASWGDPSPSERTWLSSHFRFKLAGAAPTERGVSSVGVVPPVDPI